MTGHQRPKAHTSFTDPIGNASCVVITEVKITFNVAACDLQDDTDPAQVDDVVLAYPIEINGVEVGTFDPVEWPCTCAQCDANPTDGTTITYPATPELIAAYNFGGTNTIDLNFED